MDKAADSRHVPYFIQAFVQRTMHEKITREQRLDHTHHPAPGGSFHSKTRVEHLQPEVSCQAGRSDVLVFGLRPHTIPCGWINGLNFWKPQNTSPSSANSVRGANRCHTQ